MGWEYTTRQLGKNSWVMSAASKISHLEFSLPQTSSAATCVSSIYLGEEDAGYLYSLISTNIFILVQFLIILSVYLDFKYY